MATLVFSSIGSALGGPIGGAIGALIGQSVDQQVLAPARRGPRLGDLDVQTSSYGTQIPRIYGTMRVAGSVIWSTDIIEREAVSGAKGQADAAFSYSVSFAVALSSRPIHSVGRIWADGKLVRGAAGDLKVGGAFRWLRGTEDQALDPLIASAEGLSTTPAYRGLALAVFEGLELAEFGNRIPFLTFEVVADASDPSLHAVLSDVSCKLVQSGCAAPLSGYAAYGRSQAAAIGPLVQGFGVPLVDDGGVLRAPANASCVVAEGDLGSRADGKTGAKFERTQGDVRHRPALQRLTYYEAARDYQIGEARASAGASSGAEEVVDLAAVLSAAEAKGLVQQMLARNWAEGDRLTIRLPPHFMGLEPGTEVRLPISRERWLAQKVTIEGYVAVVELRPATGTAATLPADPGRVAENPDIIAAEPVLALFDVPDPLGRASAEPTILLAASSSSGAWRSQPAELSVSGLTTIVRTSSRKSGLGRAISILGPGSAALLDLTNSVDVELVDPEQWLTSCTDDALGAGTNLAAIGHELIQYGSAVPIGSGRFRLSKLLRGRCGTEWATGAHEASEPFVLMQADRLALLSLPRSSFNASIHVQAGSQSADAIFSGEATRPPSPINLSAEREGSGDLALRWTRRSRLGWAWIDGVDVPIGEAIERYAVRAVRGEKMLDLECGEPRLTIAEALVASLGAGSCIISVRQIGDFAASRPATITINL